MERKKRGSSSKKPASYRNRLYRRLFEQGDLTRTQFRLRETDLYVLAPVDVYDLVSATATACRLQIERYLAGRPEFATALTPVPDDPLAPPIVRDMLAAGTNAGVGPMAAVAGAIAGQVGRALMKVGHKEVIVENGGDIFVSRTEAMTVGIFAGQSVLSNRLGLRLEPERMPLGICTSSATVGHSLSYGQADSVTVLADSVAVADAAATRIGNEVRHDHSRKKAVDRAIEIAGTVPRLRGVLVICGEVMGAVGEIELVPL